jgi:hypothetical protein
LTTSVVDTVGRNKAVVNNVVAIGFFFRDELAFG